MILLDVSFYDRMLFIFNYAVAWILVRLHDLLIFLGMKEGPNFAWVLAIIGLTLIVRSAIIPLYAKQIRSQRAMQELQPLMQEIREKYKGRKDQVSQQQMNQEIMNLYSEYRVNPLASCLPILIQMPFIIALYRVLLNTTLIARGEYGASSIGPINKDIASEIEKTRFLGIPLSTTFADARNAGETSWIIIIITLAVVTALIMFATMWLLSIRNMPKNASDQNAKMMKMMAFLGPVMTLFFSFVVQMGVLVYWLITNLFTSVQQMVILQKAPTKGSPAHDKFLIKANKKLDVFKKEQSDAYHSSLESWGLTDRDVNDAMQKIAKAEQRALRKDSSLEEEQEPFVPKRFQSNKSIRKEIFSRQLDDVSVEAIKKRIGSEDPFDEADNAEDLYQAVALKRQHDVRLKQKRIELGIDSDNQPRGPKKKGYFARKMEEAQELQRQTQGRQTQVGQRFQPAKKTRAQRQSEAEKNRKKNVAAHQKLSPEEIERRRQQRRKQARNRKKKKRQN